MDTMAHGLSNRKDIDTPGVYINLLVFFTILNYDSVSRIKSKHLLNAHNECFGKVK